MAWSRHLAAALLSFLVLERTSFMVRSFETCAGCMERTRTIAQYETWTKIWPDRWMPLKNDAQCRGQTFHSTWSHLISPAASFVFMHLPCELASLVTTEKLLHDLKCTKQVEPKTSRQTCWLTTTFILDTTQFTKTCIRIIRSLHQNQIKSSSYFSITFYNIL